MHSFFSLQPGTNGHSNGNGDVFSELIHKLEAEHAKQLGQLQARIVVLENQLCVHGASHPTPSEQGSEVGNCDSLRSGPDALRPSGASADEEVLELKGVWRELIRNQSHKHISIKKISDQFRVMDEQEEHEKKQQVEVAPCLRLRDFVVQSPNSTWRLYWECTGLFLVCFDMINIPLAAVFAPPDNFFSQTVAWFTLLFWTADMVQAFSVGFYEKGSLVMTQPKIVLNYLKGWFFMDALVVVPDWFLTVAGSRTQAGDLSRLLRASRAIRILRLLRVMKLQRVINKLYDMIDNEYSFIIAELIKMMIVILVLNHLIACGWFAVGKMATSLRMNSWTTWGGEDYLQADIGYQYTTSLHWTLTQFTPASMDVVARNIFERIYSIIVLLFAMVAFSSIVGTVTSSMTVIRQMKNDKQKQFWLLRRYLKQKSVSLDLTVKMTRFLEHQLNKQQKLIQAGKVTLLQQLSDQLARELAYEMYEPSLRLHTLFHFLSKEMMGVAARICQMALKSMQVATDDTIFTTGEEASKAFVIKGGELAYMHGNGDILEPPPGEKEWLAEAVIWTQWRYRGKFCAVKPSDLISLDAARFAEAVSIHPKPVATARQYGQKFVELLNSQGPNTWTDILREEKFHKLAVFEVGRRTDDDELEMDEDEDYEERDDRNGSCLNGNGHLDSAEEWDTPADADGHVHNAGGESAEKPRRVRGRCLIGVCPCSPEMAFATPRSSSRAAFWRCA